MLYKRQLLGEKYATAFEAETKKERAIVKGDRHGPWWSLQVGIDLLGYVGKYFNKTFADYLILRAGYWPDNKKKAAEALKSIYAKLTEEVLKSQDETLKTAIDVYNECIQDNNFKSYQFSPIVLKDYHEHKERTAEKSPESIKQLIKASTAYGFFKSGFTMQQTSTREEIEKKRQKAEGLYKELQKNSALIDKDIQEKVKKRLEKLSAPQKYFPSKG